MIRICLDAGHGQFNNQGYAPGYYEGTQMFKLTNYQVEAFGQYEGVEVVVTRPLITDNPSFSERGAVAQGFDFFYSNHSNAPGSPTQTTVRGVSVYDSYERPNVPLATSLGNAVARVMGSYLRGVEHRENTNILRRGQDWYGVLRNAVHVYGCKSAILMEHGFHTNPEESAWLMIDANLKRLAEEEVRVIAEYYGLQKKVIDGGDGMELKRGMGSIDNPNEDVRKWQSALIESGFKMTNESGTIEYIADGSFGGATERATQAFQKAAGLAQSGVVGFYTTLAMSSFLASRSNEQKATIASLKGDVANVNAQLANANSNLATVNGKLSQIRAIL